MSRRRARRDAARDQAAEPEPAPAPRTYRIEIVPAARRELAELPEDARRQVGRKIDSLAANPRPRGVEKLAGAEDLYRVRAGDYRILYQIRDEVLTIAVVKVGNRRDVYRRIEELRKRLE